MPSFLPLLNHAQIQDVLGAPISPSEIWEMTEDVADALQPIYSILCKEAAQGNLLHNDDTTAKILSRMKELSESEDSKRTETFTSVVLSVLKNTDIKIGLFFTGWKHAGENLEDVLNKRKSHQPIPIQQCDALSRNIPANHETQLSNCLSHLRRKFYELANLWPKEVTWIIGGFASIFSNDHQAPLAPQGRLEWHQEKSGPIMEEIKKYCEELIKNKNIEPNSSMGKAIA